MQEKQSNLIAVLSSNFNQSIVWLREQYNIVEVNKMNRKARDINGNIYIIVDIPMMAYGYEFSSYLKAPDFFTLEDVVKSRIR
jgi:hypothetical protein